MTHEHKPNEADLRITALMMKAAGLSDLPKAVALKLNLEQDCYSPAERTGVTEFSQVGQRIRRRDTDRKCRAVPKEAK